MIRLIHRDNWGLLLNWRAFWVGVHDGAQVRRTCINLIPCVTLWVRRAGGQRP